MDNLDTIEIHIHQLLDIELYSAKEILNAAGCNDTDKDMSIVYMMAINRAKQIISCVLRNMHEDK